MKRNLLILCLLFVACVNSNAQSLTACFNATSGAFPVSQCGPFNLLLTNCSTGNYNKVIWKEQISTNYTCTGPWGITFTYTDTGAAAHAATKNFSLTVYGSYKICLYVINTSTNQVDSFCQCAAIVYPFPIPNFTATDTVGCGTLTTTFTPQISSGSAPYGPLTWYFGDNSSITTNTAQAVSHTYNCKNTQPPCYTVSLAVTDVHGCSKVVTKPCYIIVPCAPQVSLSTSGGNTCTTPSTINIQASATGLAGIGIYSFWFPPLSSPPSAPAIGPTTNANTSYTFTTSGCKKIIVQVKDSLTGCKAIDSINSAICIQNIIVDSFTINATAVCCGNGFHVGLAAHVNPIVNGVNCNISGVLIATPQGGGTAINLGVVSTQNYNVYYLPCSNVSATTVYNICFQNNQLSNTCNSCVINYNGCKQLTVYPAPLAKINQTGIDTVHCSTNHQFCFNAIQNGSNSGGTFQWWAGSMTGAATTSTSFCTSFSNFGRKKIYLKVCNSIPNGNCCTYDSIGISQIPPNNDSIYVTQAAKSCDSNCVTIHIDSTKFDKAYPKFDSAYVYIFGDGTPNVASPHTTVHHCYHSAVDTCFTIKVVHITHAMGGFACADTMINKMAVQIGHKKHAQFYVTPPIQCLQNGSACFHLIPTTPNLPSVNSQKKCSEWCHWYFTAPASNAPDGELFSCDTAIVCISDLGLFNANFSVVDNGCPDTTKILNAVTVKGILGSFNDTILCNQSGVANNFCVKFKPSYTIYPTNSDSIDSTSITVIITAPACGAPTIYHLKSHSGNNAPSINHCFCFAGTYQVMMIFKNDSLGCPADTVTQSIAVSNFIAKLDLKPATTDSEQCATYQWCFTSEHSTPGRPYNYHVHWDFGDSTFIDGDANTDTTKVRPCHTFAHCGHHRIKLIVSGLTCADTVYKNIYIDDIFPNIVASPVNANCGKCVVFTNTTSFCGSPPLYTILNFGNGMIDTFYGNWTKDTFCYNLPKTTACTYLIKDVFGCTKSGTIAVNSINNIVPCINGFIDTAICVGSSINLSDCSTGVINTRCWSISNTGCNPSGACVSTSTTLAQTFNTAGYRYINLHLTNSYGCVADTCVLLHVSNPIANFIGPDSMACPGGFDSVTNATIGAYDQLTITMQSAALNYYAAFNFTKNSPTGIPHRIGIPVGYPGNYTICWKVTSSLGCADSICKNLHVSGPIGHLQCSNVYGCVGDTICCTLITNSSQNPIIRYPDGTLSLLQHNASGVYNFCHPYFNIGHQLVQVFIDDGVGCSYPVSDTVHIDGPKANFGWTPPIFDFCNKADVVMTDSSIAGLYPIDTAHYQWFIYDANNNLFASYNSHLPHVVITTLGAYTMKLVIHSTYGCYDTVIKPFVRIHPSPIAQFTSIPDTICTSGCVHFTNTSINLEAVKNYHWYFNWNNLTPVDTNTNPTYCYQTAGTYLIALVDSSIYNCVDTSNTKVVIVLSHLNIGFNILNDTICGRSDTIRFSNTTTPIAGLICKWNFGDGTSTTYSATNSTAAHYYTLPANKKDSCYTIWFYAKNNAGCSDSISKQVCISQIPAIPILLSGNKSCSPLKTLFTDTSTTPNLVNFKIQFGDGSSDFNSTSRPYNLSKTYLNTSTSVPAIYVSIYSVTNQFNCVSSTHDTFTVYPIPVACTGSDDSICPSVPFKLGCTAVNGLNYDWYYPATGNTFHPNQFVAQPTINLFQNDSFYLAVNNQWGCTDTNKVVLRIQDLIVPFAGHDTIVCVGDSIHLFAKGGISYQWIQLSTHQIISTQPQLKIQALQNENYRVIIIGACNRDSVDVSIKVFPPPKITVTPSTVNIFAGQPYTIKPDTVNNGTVQWQPAYNINCPTCLNPVVSPEVNTVYGVTFTDEYGCVDTTKVTFIVLCDKDKSLYIPNAFEPKPTAKFENRFFYVQGWGLKELVFLRVYDRWGNEIYEAEHVPIGKPEAGWDGTFKGKPMMSDVYMYQMQVECVNGTLFPIAGNVTLIR